MAATDEGAHGGMRENSGRKRKYDGSVSSQKGWNSQNKRLYISLKIFDAWRDAKAESRYKSCSDSDFASHLLSLEYRRRENLNQEQPRHRKGTEVFTVEQSSESDEQESNTGTFPSFIIDEGLTSTPLKDRNPIPTSSLAIPSVSPVLMTDVRFMDTDVSLHESSNLDLSKGLNASLFTDDEGELTDDSSSEKNISFQDLTKSVLEELNADKNIMERQSDSNSSNHGIGGDEDVEDDIFEMVEEHESDCSDDVNLQQQSRSTNESTVPFGPHNKFTRGDEVYSMKEEYKMVKGKKCVCSLDLLLQIFQSRCQTPGCPAEPRIHYHFIGVTLIINSVCSSGHNYSFCSSHQVNDIYANNIQAATSIMLSGNQFAKIERMAKFLNLVFLSSSTYYRFQRLYLIPEINEWWSSMRKEIISGFADTEIVVGGDGQCDSPGFNAKNLCYFIMEVNTNHILDIEVLDKRHVGLVSTNMEKEAVKRSMDRLIQEVKVSELVTDASTTVKALLEARYTGIVHSLDVWHKAKSIKKCLTKLGKPKAMKKVKDWSAHIITHFWHCSSACRKDETTSDEEALKVLKDMWIGLLHHICNEHEWLGGKCDHDEGEHDESLPWFDRRDNDFMELQKVILNPGLLDSFKYYTRFRHTGGIECANNLGLVYTPKQTAFSYRAYKARRQLAAIDWNFHLHLPQAKSQSGKDLVTRKYNPRTRQWDVKTIKVAKGYAYIPVLTSRVLRRRALDIELVTQITALNTSDPGLISPTIAHVPPPSTKEIAERRSRFKR